MKLARLVLSNYRGFEALDVTFDPRLTLLVGKNGSGKSSVLDAITTCAFLSTSVALGKAPSRHDGPGDIPMSDVRGGARSANVISTWHVDGTAYTFEAERMTSRTFQASADSGDQPG
jgi:DNA repair exonuclease SbcCD ATPase subunit